jgi:adenylate cyclase
LSGERVERRLAAILAADVAAYSRLMGQHEAGTLARLKTLRLRLAMGEERDRDPPPYRVPENFSA